jgi:UDP-sulfoquinovose synthase
MKILIIGIDGYLGWPLAQYLSAREHVVGGIDAYYRRDQVKEVGGQSAVSIVSPAERIEAYQEKYAKEIYWVEGDISEWEPTAKVFEEFKPEAIVHLGENPSAPYSMIDQQHATWVQKNNVIGSLNVLYAMKEFTPNAHLVKLGTMGEYGQPNVDIPEGFFEVEYRGRKDKLLFPRQAGSWYHQTKVHDTHNTIFACKIWGLRSTDIMQGVVYGTRIEEMGEEDLRLRTRLDFDECFGTAINRFACQAAVGEPLTPYGKGNQKRGYLPLRDSMQCLTLALENPPEEGEYRTFNQFEDTYNVYELAETVKKVAVQLGLDAQIHRIENPRIEKEDHYYNPDHQHLMTLGYVPTSDMESEVKLMLQDLVQNKERIEKVKEVLIPQIRWDGSKCRSKLID